METIFSNCDGCNNLDALTEYENELLCERCLGKALDDEEEDDPNYQEDDNWFNGDDYRFD